LGRTCTAQLLLPKADGIGYTRIYQANIKHNELVEYRRLAELYARKSNADIANELKLKELVEICDGYEAEVQK
jgi:hypothetical protein